jgi:hypothetical protein
MSLCPRRGAGAEPKTRNAKAADGRWTTATTDNKQRTAADNLACRLLLQFLQWTLQPAACSRNQIITEQCHPAPGLLRARSAVLFPSLVLSPRAAGSGQIGAPARPPGQARQPRAQPEPELPKQQAAAAPAPAVLKSLFQLWLNSTTG